MLTFDDDDDGGGSPSRGNRATRKLEKAIDLIRSETLP